MCYILGKPIKLSTFKIELPSTSSLQLTITVGTRTSIAKQCGSKVDMLTLRTLFVAVIRQAVIKPVVVMQGLLVPEISNMSFY